MSSVPTTVEGMVCGAEIDMIATITIKIIYENVVVNYFRTFYEGTRVAGSLHAITSAIVSILKHDMVFASLHLFCVVLLLQGKIRISLKYIFQPNTIVMSPQWTIHIIYLLIYVNLIDIVLCLH